MDIVSRNFDVHASEGRRSDRCERTPDQGWPLDPREELVAIDAEEMFDKWFAKLQTMRLSPPPLVTYPQLPDWAGLTNSSRDRLEGRGWTVN